MESNNSVLLSSIKLDSDVPLYYQILSIIKRSISVGILKPGDMLPSESTFCETYNVSRTTIRQAIGELESEGLVVRRRGKGTFISEPKMKRKMEDIYSFTKEMRSLGLKPSSKVIRFEIIEADQSLCDSMRIELAEHIFKITRIRLADGEPLLLETSFVPTFIYPNLTKEMLEKESLYAILNGLGGIVPMSAEESYETVIIKKSIADLLKCKPNSSGFFVERKAWGQTGEVYELTQSIIRGDRTKFVVKLKNNDISFNRDMKKTNGTKAIDLGFDKV